ncbi:hypothetical protein [Shigella sonnei]|uniref:hypothetical protein n=2 Tax=Shigella sonnei TaxID=624 RepID=UPI000663ACD8|nr:hypothetical protein [Shigella sonnei]CSQ81850.1 Uncharacterised protein [Shigella sonnei]
MHKNITKYFFIGFLFYGAAAFQASAKESANIVFSMSVPRPSCSVSVESSRNLGELEKGVQEHSDFPVNVKCSGSVRHALTAEPVVRRGLQSDNERIFVPIGERSPSGAGPFLSLRDEKGSTIKLTGKKGDAFCTSTDNDDSCYITPVTEVTESSPVGTGSVAIRFNVVYL